MGKFIISKNLFVVFMLLIVPWMTLLSAQEYQKVVGQDTVIIIDEDTVYSYLLAASQGDSILVLALLKAGVQVDTATWEGITALMYAVQNNHVGTVKVLAENGAKLNRKDFKGNSPLLVAVQNGNLEMAEYLIRKGADINLGDKHGVTPLMLAAGVDSFALADMLIYYDADVLLADKNGTTALMITAVTGNYSLASALLEAGADVNCRDKNGYTPLFAATWYGYWSFLELLLDYEADPNVVANNGYTALSVAVEADDLYATKLLLAAGSDLNHRISFSQNPLTIAVEKRNDSIAAILWHHHARFNAWPSFSKFGLGTEMNFNADDYRWSFFFMASERKYGLSVSGGWGFRPSAIRVLENVRDTLYQFWEKRGNLFLSIDKSMFLVHGKKNFRAGLYAGLKGIYTYGSYRGTGEKPNDRLLVAPGAGLCLQSKVIRFTAGYEYLNLDLYKISPHRFNISICLMWNRKKNNFKHDFINW
ncbi:MAG: ankyrin repeat domain-containing protein [Bacteroidales bacterium]|nr:ankyrin repeat domain-containing protein [Bacteroidales bacterium]